MGLNDELKKKIREFNDKLDESTELDDRVEQTLDYLIDNDIVDLSEDEDGDMYESYNNSVWEYIEEEVQL